MDTSARRKSRRTVCGDVHLDTRHGTRWTEPVFGIVSWSAQPGELNAPADFPCASVDRVAGTRMRATLHRTGIRRISAGIPCKRRWVATLRS